MLAHVTGHELPWGVVLVALGVFIGTVFALRAGKSWQK